MPVLHQLPGRLELLAQEAKLRLRLRRTAGKALALPVLPSAVRVLLCEMKTWSPRWYIYHLLSQLRPQLLILGP